MSANNKHRENTKQVQTTERVIESESHKLRKNYYTNTWANETGCCRCKQFNSVIVPSTVGSAAAASLATTTSVGSARTLSRQAATKTTCDAASAALRQTTEI